MVLFSNQKYQIWVNFGGPLVYFITIWNILWPFGMCNLWPFGKVCGHLLCFPIWYVLTQEKSGNPELDCRQKNEKRPAHRCRNRALWRRSPRPTWPSSRPRRRSAALQPEVRKEKQQQQIKACSKTGWPDEWVKNRPQCIPTRFFV
jgi:hypothetical protein